MLQMVHNPDATEPRVCLQDEDADSYGPTIMPETGEALALCPSVLTGAARRARRGRLVLSLLLDPAGSRR
jgi:hypothetical protein